MISGDLAGLPDRRDQQLVVYHPKVGERDRYWTCIYILDHRDFSALQ